MLPGGYLCKKWNLKYGDNKEMRNTATDLTEGTPWKIIMRFSIPLFFTFLLQQFYNMVDTIIVGKCLGVSSLAAVGSTGSIQFMIIGFCTGACSGFAIPVAQKFGAGDYKGMRKFVANAGWLSAVFAVVMTTVVGALCMNILQWMNTPEDIIQGAYDYIFVIFLGIPVMFGASLLKIVHYGLAFSAMELFFMVAAMVIAFIVSMYSIQFLLGYVKKHDFKFFGYYRIVLGVIVLIYFGLTAILAK